MPPLTFAKEYQFTLFFSSYFMTGHDVESYSDGTHKRAICGRQGEISKCFEALIFLLQVGFLDLFINTHLEIIAMVVLSVLFIALPASRSYDCFSMPPQALTIIMFSLFLFTVTDTVIQERRKSFE